MKKKKTKKDPEPADRRDPDIPDPARLLRELYERGMAELAERRKVDPNAR